MELLIFFGVLLVIVLLSGTKGKLGDGANIILLILEILGVFACFCFMGNLFSDLFGLGGCAPLW